jgi:hypothetical protein
MSYSANNARKDPPVLPLPSLPAQGSFSHAEHLARLNSGPSRLVSKRAYSFVQEQTQRTNLIEQPVPSPTSPCSPDVGISKTHIMHSKPKEHVADIGAGPDSRLRNISLRSGVTRIRSSSAIADGRPGLHRSRTDSTITTMDALSDGDAVNLLLLKVGAQLDEPGYLGHNRSGHRSRWSFGSLLGEEDLDRVERKKDEHPVQQVAPYRRHSSSQDLAKARAADIGAAHNRRLRDMLIRLGMMPTVSPSPVANCSPVLHPSRTGSLGTTVDTTISNDPSLSPPSFKVGDQLDEPGCLKRNGSRGSFESLLEADSERAGRQRKAVTGLRVPPGCENTQSQILMLEREREALARRIRELRAIAMATETVILEDESDYEREEMMMGKGKDKGKGPQILEGESQAKSPRAHRHQAGRNDDFTMMMEPLGKVREQRTPERNSGVARKFKFVRTASLPKLEVDLDPSNTGIEGRQVPTTPGSADSATGRICSPPLKRAVGIMPLPTLTPPRVRIPSHEEYIPAQARRTSTGSQSFIGHSNFLSIVSSNAARKEAELRTQAKRRLSDAQLAKGQHRVEDQRAEEAWRCTAADWRERAKRNRTSGVMRVNSIIDAGDSHEACSLTPVSTQTNSIDPILPVPRDVLVIGRQMVSNNLGCCGLYC